MKKLSSAQVAEVIGQVGPTLRAISAENQALKEKIAHFERQGRVQKLASEMKAKNLNPDQSYEETVENLMGSDDLDVIEKAVDMSAQQVKLASVSDHPGNASDSLAAFEAAILGD